MAKFEFNDFGNASSAAFLGDFGSREHILPGGAQLDDSVTWSGATSRYTVTVNDADVNAGETAITVVALPAAIPAGTTLDFGDQVAVTTADAALGATSLTVEELGEDIANGATASYDADLDEEVVPAGTLVGRTVAERNSGASFGPAADADDEIFITVADVDLDQTTDVDLVRHGTLIKTNFLPAYAAASATIKGKLEAKYQLILG